MNLQSVFQGLLLVGCALATMACPSLPRNFESLPLPAKIAAYEAHFCNHGLAQQRAEACISWHGWEAAAVMVEYLAGRRVGLLPKTTAIHIIAQVQDRGCTLEGTAAERALEAIVGEEPPESQEAFFARQALDSIRNDRFFPDGPDSLKGSPCEGRPPRPPQYDLQAQQ